MRKLNRGQCLTRAEINEIAENVSLSYHASQRLTERFGYVDYKEVIQNAKFAYFNTDYSINVCMNERQCYVVVDLGNGLFKIVTVKEDTDLPMSKKRELAMRGVGRIEGKGRTGRR